MKLVKIDAQDYKAAVGIRFSSKAALINNSISLKYFFSEKTAVESLISLNNPFALGFFLSNTNHLLQIISNIFMAGVFMPASAD